MNSNVKLGIFSFGRKMSNIGDQVQKIGFVNALRMHSINIDEYPTLYGYDERPSEPVSYIAYGYYDYNYGLKLFPIGENENPIFLSMHCADEKRVGDFESIADRIPFVGCRDYATYEFFKRNMPHVPCFMSGCFSLIQEKRDSNIKGNKYYLVDIDDELRRYIPKEILNNCDEMTHDNYFFNCDNEMADKNADEFVREWLEKLKKNAKLVITSRLHCALPCVAMGIPVVVARGYRDNTDRYSGFEKLFHVYMPDEYSQINWEPEVKDIEHIKAAIADNVAIAFNAIKDNLIYDKTFVEDFILRWKEIHNFFYPTKYEPFFVGTSAGYLSHSQKLKFLSSGESSIIKFITQKDLSQCTLVIYGAGDRGKYFVNRYEEEMCFFKKTIYVDGDENKQGTEYVDIPIESPDILKREKDVVIIIAVDQYYSRAGREISKWLANEVGLLEGIDFMFLDKLDSSSKLEMTKAVLNAPLL